MRVAMKIEISGSRDGSAWPGKGGVVDVSDAEAAELIANGHAEPAPAPASVRAKVERATARPAEKRKG